MLLGTRIKQIAKERKISVAKIEEMSGVGVRTINRWDVNIPSFDKVILVADALQISVDELLGRERAGSLKLNQKYSALDAHGREVVDLVLNAEYDRCTEKADEIIDISTIRHYLSSPAAGANGQVAGEDYEDIPRPTDCPRDADYCLTVNGDSMDPYIPDGSMVYVKRDAPINDLDVGVFCVDGATYVKQYTLSYDGSVYLLSANPKREEANIKLSKNGSSGMFCLGKVLLKKKLPMPVYEP